MRTLKELRTGKKGALTDIFVFMILALIIAVICVTFFFAGQKTQEELLNNAPQLQASLGDAVNVTEVIAESVGPINTAYASLKWITVMLIAGLILSILVNSYYVRTQPIFFLVHFLVSFIAVVVSVPISNAYETIYQTPILASSFSGFWGQSFIFLNLPTWVTVIMGVSGILIYINMVRGDSFGSA